MNELQFGSLNLPSGKPSDAPVEPRRKQKLEQLLKKAKANQEKLAALSGTAAGQAMRIEQSTEGALKRLQGESVKSSDPKYLAKALRKKNASKRKSEKEWKQRKRDDAEKNNAIHKKRNENVSAGVAKKNQHLLEARVSRAACHRC